MAAGATLKVQSLFSTVADVAAAGPAPLVCCLLRLSRCFCSSAVCLLCRRVFYSFLLFCALLLFCFPSSQCHFFLFYFFFFQQPSRRNRPLLRSNGFSDTSKLFVVFFLFPSSSPCAKVDGARGSDTRSDLVGLCFILCRSCEDFRTLPGPGWPRPSAPPSPDQTRRSVWFGFFFTAALTYFSFSLFFFLFPSSGRHCSGPIKLGLFPPWDWLLAGRKCRQHAA